MQTIGRRTFCGTAVMAFPMLMLHADEKGNRSGQSGTVIDSLADEFTRITTDGAHHGFRGEHFRRYAGIVRTLDAYMEDKGRSTEVNNRLDDDDFDKVNPAFAAHITTEFWNKHGIEFRENDLAAQYAIDRAKYLEIKKAIKKQGGVRALHASIADIFERKAKDHETVALKSGADVRNGRLVLSPPRKSQRSEFTTIQFPFVNPFMSPDCICLEMVVAGCLMVALCVTLIAPECCPIAASIFAFEKLLESLGLCRPSDC